MSGSNGSATTVVDSLPGYVKEFVYSGSYDSKGNLDDSKEHGKSGYLPWAVRLATNKESNELWYYIETDSDGNPILDSNGNYIEISTYAEQDTKEKEGIKKLAYRGRYGYSIIKNKAIPYIEDVLDGNYLTGTKAEFNTMLENVMDKPKKTFETIMDEIGTSLYAIGDLSSGNLAKENIADSKYYDRTESLIKAQNYKSERRRQEHAINYGIEYGKQSVIDAETLRMAGLYQREYKQGKLTDAYKKDYDKLVTKIRRLEILGNAIRALVGTHEAETKPYYRPSPIVGIMGGAMAGAAAGAMLAAPTGGMSILVGALIGAAGGGLLGGLSSM